MADFMKFKEAVQEQFKKMVSNGEQIYITEVTKDDLWNEYIEGFPEGTNEIFRERRNYECNCCRSFIRSYGNMVTIVKNKLVSIWDAENLDYPFKEVSDKLALLVKSAKIRDIFFTDSKKAGVDKSFEEGDKVLTWDHFFLNIPTRFVTKDSIPALKGQHRDSKNVFQRSLAEFTLDAGETILDLISQGSIYRGEEHKVAVQTFILKKTEYNSVDVSERDNWSWVNSYNSPISRIRNNAIGTLGCRFKCSCNKVREGNGSRELQATYRIIY